ARLLRPAGGDAVAAGRSVCVLAVGKMVEAALKAAGSLAAGAAADRVAADRVAADRVAADRVAADRVEVWDVRCCTPLDDEMLAAAARHAAVITVEDGIREGGVGAAIAGRLSRLRPELPVTVLG